MCLKQQTSPGVESPGLVISDDDGLSQDHDRGTLNGSPLEVKGLGGTTYTSKTTDTPEFRIDIVESPDFWLFANGARRAPPGDVERRIGDFIDFIRSIPCIQCEVRFNSCKMPGAVAHVRDKTNGNYVTLYGICSDCSQYGDLVPVVLNYLKTPQQGA